MHSHADAELAATYVVERVAARAGSRLRQGARKPSLSRRPLGPSLDLVAGTRLVGVSQAVATALVAWGLGQRRVRRLEHVPRPLDVLAWQATGERCVSLLPDDVPAAPHADGLAFAMHDLCHLEKFVDPKHHAGQVGFFRSMHEAMTRPAWGPFVERFDVELVREIEHVVADMNGSAVFLFAALKMKLKMAVRRRVARELGRRAGEVHTSGPLDADEQAAFDQELLTLLDLLALRGDVRSAALSVSTRRDDPDAALSILARFEALGIAQFDSAGSTPPDIAAWESMQARSQDIPAL